MAVAFRNDVRDKYVDEIKALEGYPEYWGSEEIRCPDAGCDVAYSIIKFFPSSDQEIRNTIDTGLRGDHPNHPERTVFPERSKRTAMRGPEPTRNLL